MISPHSSQSNAACAIIVSTFPRDHPSPHSNSIILHAKPRGLRNFFTSKLINGGETLKSVRPHPHSLHMIVQIVQPRACVTCGFSVGGLHEDKRNQIHTTRLLTSRHVDTRKPHGSMSVLLWRQRDMSCLVWRHLRRCKWANVECVARSTGAGWDVMCGRGTELCD